MARLNILEYPDPRLRTSAEPVQRVDDSVRTLIDDMLETMYAAPGIGLAASQVDVHKRVIVIDISENADTPHVFVNPELELSRRAAGNQRGLPVGTGHLRAGNPARAGDRAPPLGRDGNPFTLQADGLLSVCIQHECDHLDGKLFVDYLSNLKRARIRKKLKQNRA